MVIFRKRVAGLSEATLTRFVIRARQAVKVRGSVNMLVTGNREMKALNRRFRRKDKPTDVLSFPAEGGNGFLGDVAISADIASQNARRLGHTSIEEIKILALHGILHLAGYDHENDHGEMARTEEQLRRSLRLPVGLIERVGSRAQGSRGKSRPSRSTSTRRSTKRRRP